LVAEVVEPGVVDIGEYLLSFLLDLFNDRYGVNPCEAHCYSPCDEFGSYPDVLIDGFLNGCGKDMIALTSYGPKRLFHDVLALCQILVKVFKEVGNGGLLILQVGIPYFHE
jgi:hypothetical protein